MKQSGGILANDRTVRDMDRIIVILCDGGGYEAKLKCVDESAVPGLAQIDKNVFRPPDPAPVTILQQEGK